MDLGPTSNAVAGPKAVQPLRARALWVVWRRCSLVIPTRRDYAPRSRLAIRPKALSRGPSLFMRWLLDIHSCFDIRHSPHAGLLRANKVRKPRPSRFVALKYSRYVPIAAKSTFGVQAAAQEGMR